MRPPRVVQLLSWIVRLVVVRTVKGAPGKLVKLKRNTPFGCTEMPERIGAGGTGVCTRQTAPVPGIAFANIVAMAKPGGKLFTGSEVKALEVQLADVSNVVKPLSRLRS